MQNNNRSQNRFSVSSRLLFSALLIWLLSGFLTLPGNAAAPTTPDEARLSADRMRYDSKTGDFLATGNVIIQADGLTVAAPRGTGNIRRKEVLFQEGIVASGDWQGEWVDLTAGSISLIFQEPFSYTVENKVKGDLGKITVDADKFSMKGTSISAERVRHLEDREVDIVFGAESVEGTLVDGILTTLTATSKVWLRGRPNRSGETVDIRGDKAVYSVERGSVVLSGNVRAVQQGRTLTSHSVVYFPANNRVEAIGGNTSNTSADRAIITIDLKREEQRRRK